MITYICGITYVNLPLIRYESCSRIKFRSWFYTFLTFNHQPGCIMFFLNRHLPSSGNYKNTHMIMNDYINDYINILFMQYKVCIWYLQERNNMCVYMCVWYYCNYYCDIIIYQYCKIKSYLISEIFDLTIYIFSYSLYMWSE